MDPYLCASCNSPTYCDAPQARCSACAGELYLDARYRLDRLLARGAVGSTYLATRLEDGARLAIKELSIARLDSFQTQELFAREARVLYQLDHPAIPTCHDDFIWGVGKHQAFYLVEDFIEGESLAEELSHRRHDEPSVLAILRELAHITDYLHTRTPAIIHRDIKPDNVMRRAGSGQLVLIDFGAVRDGATSKNTLIGTPGYMPPEQLHGEALPASDVYALGILAVELLTRQDPHTLTQQNGQTGWRHAVERHVSESMLALLDAMLAHDPGERIRDGGALAARIALLESTPDGAMTHVPKRALARPERAPKGERALATTRAPNNRYGESLFGVYLLAAGAILGVSPCVVLFVGLGEAAVGASALLLVMILLIPFLSNDEEAEPERKLLEE